jgi:C-terminal processing protease CtpA/Prc
MKAAAKRNQVADALDDLIDAERRIEEIIESARASSPAMQPKAASLLESLRKTSQHQREALEAQRQRAGAGALSSQALPNARLLRTVYGGLNEIALAYAVLHARAHRAFDSQTEGNTADLAEAHLRTYSTAIQELDLLISDIVISELGAAGEDCQCQCPACGLGICLCASHGANTVRQVWRETIPPAPEGGLRVRRPRAGSEAERAGLLDGDRVLAIDGNEIGTDLDISTVQAAIRAQSAGGRMRLRVLRDGGGPIELILRRA